VVSGIYTFTSRTPLAIGGTGCVTVSAYTCEPNLTTGFAGAVRQGGNFGRGLIAAQLSTTQFINPAAFSTPANYTFGNAPHTAPYSLRGPGGYIVNMSLRRTFGLIEHAKLMMEVDAINLTNRTNFGNPKPPWSAHRSAKSASPARRETFNWPHGSSPKVRRPYCL
jgi:hypothetical protein